MQYLRWGLPHPVQLLSNIAKESSKAWEMYPVGSLTTWFYGMKITLRSSVHAEAESEGNK